MADLKTAIEIQKNSLLDWITPSLAHIVCQCARVWEEPDAIDNVLLNNMTSLPSCSLGYVVDKTGEQVSGNILQGGADRSVRGQDLSTRPFFTENDRKSVQFVSPVYISKATHKPCLTVTHEIVGFAGTLYGYLAVDIALSELPLVQGQEVEKQKWQQIKGDPAIRSTLFMQTRSVSLMDRHLDDVVDTVTNLILEQGVFHAKLHFSSSRASLWNMNNPHDYQIHVLEDITDPTMCLIYPNRSYPQKAKIKAELVPAILNEFKELRQLDETIYLRSASLNIMNDMVSLTFSCDGTHYMTSQEFLTRGPKLF